MKEYIYLLKENIFWTFLDAHSAWTTAMKISLKVLMDAKQDSFTKRWLFLNH